MQITRRHIALIFLCLYLTTLGFLCFADPQNFQSASFSLWNIQADKIVHFIMFAPYPVLTFITVDIQSRSIVKRLFTLILVLLSGAVLALGTEIIQGTTEYRSFELWDLAADIAGMLTSAIALVAYIYRQTGRNQNE